MMEKFLKIFLDCWKAVLYLKKCLENKRIQCHGAIWSIPHNVPGILLSWGGGGREKTLLKIRAQSHQYCYNSAQYLTNALFTLGWFRQIQGSVVHRCCSSFAWHTIKKKTTNYFKNKGNRKVCLLQQQTSMEASGETEGKTSE